MSLILFALLFASDPWPYWIQPCTAAAAAESGCKTGDPQLAEWALQAWQRTAGAALSLTPSATEKAARLRIYWASGRTQLYGEARPFVYEGRRGSEVYVLPGMAKDGDPLMRETVVYLTCLHESGHGLGLAHTAAFADIMYSFQFGGDIAEYFGRYRRVLIDRADIPKHSGISPADAAALALLRAK